MYKSLYYIYIVAKNTVEQKKKVVFQMMNHIIFMLFSIYLYTYIYSLLPSLNARLPFPNAIWSMAVYFMVFWLSVRNVERRIREDIVSGNIEMYLLRPIGYISQKVFVILGQGFVSFVSATILSVLVSYFMVGLPEINFSYTFWIFGIITTLIMSQIVTFLLFILCGLAGFWTENSEPFHFITSKLIMVFGGAWVPIAFFPKALQLFAQYSPFGGAMSLTYSMYPDFQERFPFLVASGVFWIIICLILVKVFSKRAFTKLAING